MDDHIDAAVDDTPLLLQDSSQNGPLTSPVQIFDWLGRPASSRGKLGGSKTLVSTLGTVCLAYTSFCSVYLNLVLFFKNVLHLGNAEASNQTNYWLGTIFLFALFGAFVAEASPLRRLWTCALSLFLHLMGMMLLTFSALRLIPRSTISSGSTILFYISLYLVALGSGAFQPALQSLGADQFDTVADKSNFFTWYLVFDNVGIVLADTLGVYLMTGPGWAVGFWFAAGMAGATFLLFIVGLPMYRQYGHSGDNPYYQALQVFVSATRKWKVRTPLQRDLLYEIPDDDVNSARGSRGKLPHTESWRFLDKAATVFRSDDVARDPWKLCTVTQVEEVKQVLRLLPIWGCSIFFYTIYAQGGTFYVEQGLLLDGTVAGSFQMQAATMNLFNLAMVVFGPPIYDACFVPIARKFSGFSRGLTPLQRIGAGYVISGVSLIFAAVLESIRLRLAGNEQNLSIFWEAPQYIVLGIAQFLGAIGQLEFFYMEAPASMRSLGSSFYCTSIALGNYLSSVLVIIVNSITSRNGDGGWIPVNLNEGHLDYFFWVLAGLTCLNVVVHCVCARSFQHASPADYKSEPIPVSVENSS